jgi:hypothetical protein
MSDLTGMGTLASSVSSVIDNVMARLWPRPEDRANADAIKMRAELEATMAPIQAQLDVAKIEAASPHWFVAGARPSIIWVGSLSLFMYYGIGSAVGIGLWAYACISAGGLVPRPDLGLDDIIGLIGPMLGVSWLRSQDKRNGVATQSVRR